MERLKYYEQLRTGDEFTARAENGQKVRYQYIGMNLHAMAEGKGFIMLRRLSTGEVLNVDTAWLTDHRITIERNKI